MALKIGVIFTILTFADEYQCDYLAATLNGAVSSEQIR